MITYGYGFTANYINWSCPNELRPYEDAYLMRRKQTDTEMYMQGLYFREALLSSVCNNSLWMKKGSKPHEYPKKTFMDTIEEEQKIKNNVLTEEEKIKQTQMLFNSLSIMQANFNLNHKDKDKNG